MSLENNIYYDDDDDDMTLSFEEYSHGYTSPRWGKCGYKQFCEVSP